MKLRYQMRGLGIGIIVTALLMGVVKGEKIPLSDAEIRVRALELGMVEGNSMKLSDLPPATAQPQQEGEDSAPYGVNSVPIEDGDAAPEEGQDAGSERESGAEDGSDDGAVSDTGEDSDGGAVSDAKDGSGDEGVVSDSGTEQENSGETGDSVTSGEVTLVIESGVTSYSVCRQLAELGLVEDAARFDDYLCEIGYSRGIQYGTYQIPREATEEEIAKIITRQ